MKWIKWLYKKPSSKQMQDEKPTQTLGAVLQKAARSADFHTFSPVDADMRLQLHYYRSLVDEEKLRRDLLPSLQVRYVPAMELGEVKGLIPFDQVKLTDQAEEVEQELVRGHILLTLGSQHDQALLIGVSDTKSGHRQNNETENEFSVVGPKVGFVENLDINMKLLRQKINVPELIMEELMVGSMSHTRVMLVSIEGITNPELLQKCRQRIQDINFDIVYDSSLIDQIISDNSNTPFPLFLSTERLDRVTYAVTSGQVAFFVDGSPYVITGPSTLLDFFISPEDYYLTWVMGSFFRLIRIASVLFSVYATAFYVAILTYHYEVIPDPLLEPLIQSRTNVPFDPVLEVLFLEITIELLREAGARLPAKIGQTLGIVGGIVIGQASVQAALTSNVLLIIVALSALASFTTPIFKMANTIRLLRFPFILLAACWGGFGLALGTVVLLGHLLRLKSLGTPYLIPLYPFRSGNFVDSFIRGSFQYTTRRSRFLHPLKTKRYEPEQDKEDIRHED